MRSSRPTRAPGAGVKEAEVLSGAEAGEQQGEGESLIGLSLSSIEIIFLAAKYEEDQHHVLAARRMEPGQGAGAGDPRR